MMDEKLLNELVQETSIEDVSERYREIVEIVGVEKFVQLSSYAHGQEIYFPKVESVIASARNRRIKKEFNGYNYKELAKKYNVTVQHIWRILKDEPPIGQMSLEDMLN